MVEWRLRFFFPSISLSWLEEEYIQSARRHRRREAEITPAERRGADRGRGRVLIISPLPLNVIASPFPSSPIHPPIPPLHPLPRRTLSPSDP
ncbi:unnamed protein product [Nezara viridula]|uniref:Uncharacterized protein n=1 Tax=Nezara viridula TaxID=85310 RepID=A0A9P0HM92_NEZVI|nr:unnamed protein product [Nezara viridula]